MEDHPPKRTQKTITDLREKKIKIEKEKDIKLNELGTTIQTKSAKKSAILGAEW